MQRFTYRAAIAAANMTRKLDASSAQARCSRDVAEIGPRYSRDVGELDASSAQVE